MKEVTLKSTEKYEIIFQSTELKKEAYKRLFENACYNILRNMNEDIKDLSSNSISLTLGICTITDLTGRTPKYEINRPAYKIETLRNPEIIGSVKYMDLMMEFVKRLINEFKNTYDEVVLIAYTENGPFCKYFEKEEDK